MNLKMELDAEMSLSKHVFTINIPFTRLRIKVVRQIIDQGLIDEINKELMLIKLRRPKA